MLPTEISRYYEETAEEGRLVSGPSQLEFERTKEIVLRCLPAPPATVLDVGGAAGSYSLWLTENGYDAHLVDATPRLVKEAARRSAAAAKPIRTCQVADARALPFDARSADALLLLGPLYHLTSAADRLQAFHEAHRVVRPGGMICAAAISRCASALDGISRDLFADPAFWPIVEQDLIHGQHRNTTGNPEYFTTAYFHHPDELEAELTSAGFRCEGVFGLEGPGWMLPDFAARWNHPRTREDLLRVARALEREPSVVGLSAHLLGVGVKE